MGFQRASAFGAELHVDISVQDLSIVFRNAEANIDRAIRTALDATANWTRDRAQDYAPVRDVFAHGRRGFNRKRYYGRSAETNAPSSASYSRAKRSGTGFLHSVDRTRVESVTRGVKKSHGKWVGIRRSYNTEATRQRFLKAFHKQRERGHEFFYPEEGTRHRVRVGMTGQWSPTARSLNPVVNTGEERVYLPAGRQIGRTIPMRKGSAEIIHQKIRAYSDKRGPFETTIDDYLSARGRGEYARAARLARKLESTKEGMTTESFARKAREMGIGARVTSGGRFMMGGRLRDSITRGGIDDDGSSMSVEVYTDPSQQDYAAYQEYGTSRHVAQPFMRPALYESRQVLLRNINKELQKKR